MSGFWHGANWTFIAWGGIHAALFLPLLLRGTNRRYTSDTIGEGRWLPTGRELLGMAWTFSDGVRRVGCSLGRRVSGRRWGICSVLTRMFTKPLVSINLTSIP